MKETETKKDYGGDWLEAVLDATRPKSLPYVYIADSATLQRWSAALLASEHRTMAVDTETTGLNPRTDSLVTVQMYVEGQPPIIVDARRIERYDLRKGLLPLLGGREFLKVGHNLSFDYAFLREHLDIRMERLFCTKIAENLLTAGLPMGCSLADTMERRLGQSMDKSVRLDFTTIGDQDFTEEMMVYAARDVTPLIDLMYAQYAALKSKDLMEVARLEMGIIPAIAEASIHGVLIDAARWRAHIEALTIQRDELEADLIWELQPYYVQYVWDTLEEKKLRYMHDLANYTEARSMQESLAQVVYDEALEAGASKKEARAAFNAYKREHPLPVKRPTAPVEYAGEPINLGSYDQLQGALSFMGVELPEKESGKLETDRRNLTRVAHEYPVVARLLEYRGYDKLIVAFGENLLRFLDEESRLHPEFRQCDTDTGRMACARPNVQQIPGNELGQEFRNCFIASPGYSLISADYSQIELRILVEFAGDEGAIEAINAGLDLHSQTAANMFGVPYDEVIALKDTTHKQIRHVAKMINFGLAYGLTPGGLAANLNLAPSDAKDYFERWQAANPVITRWLKHTKEACFNQGYAQTALGRKRFSAPLPFQRYESPREYAYLKEGVQRQLTNMVIQGTSADITKLAVRGIYEQGIAESLDAHMVMFVHDEIVVECPTEVAEEVAFIIKSEMERAARTVLKRVNAAVEYKIAEYWSH